MNILLLPIVAMGSMGAFAINNRSIDIIVMLLSGILGYFMRKTGFELAPLVLGLILSQIIENNIRRTQVLARGDLLGYFFSRPISILLAVLVIGTLVWPMIQNILSARKNGATATAEDDTEE